MCGREGNLSIVAWSAGVVYKRRWHCKVDMPDELGTSRVTVAIVAQAQAQATRAPALPYTFSRSLERHRAINSHPSRRCALGCRAAAAKPSLSRISRRSPLCTPGPEDEMNQHEAQDQEVLPYPLSNFGSTSSALIPATQVMSPNLAFHEGILDNVQASCQICFTAAHGPAVCAGCGVYGHAECLRLERFFDYLFCSTCIPKVAAEYASFQDAQRREAWRRSLDTDFGKGCAIKQVRKLTFQCGQCIY